MDVATQTAVAPVSKARFWIGVVLSAIPVLMLTMSAVMKVMQPAPDFAKGMEHLGWGLHLAIPLAVLEITCTLLYLIPRTSVLGAILLAAYLGGATATHVRVGDPWFIPVLLGVSLWLGLWLREPRLHDVLPLRK
jgi:hypothetical protein